MVFYMGSTRGLPLGVSVSREGTKWSGPPQKGGPWLICGTGTQPASFRHNDLLAGRLASSRPVAWQGRAERRRPPLRQSNKFAVRSEEHTSELQSLMRISYAVFCLKKKNNCTQTQ